MSGSLDDGLDRRRFLPEPEPEPEPPRPDDPASAAALEDERLAGALASSPLAFERLRLRLLEAFDELVSSSRPPRSPRPPPLLDRLRPPPPPPLASRVARRLMGPRTGVREVNTQPMPGTGLPPMRRPSSKSHSYSPWNSWNESLDRMVAPARSATWSTKASPRPMVPAGGVMISALAIAASNSSFSEASMR